MLIKNSIDYKFCVHHNAFELSYTEHDPYNRKSINIYVTNPVNKPLVEILFDADKKIPNQVENIKYEDIKTQQLTEQVMNNILADYPIPTDPEIDEIHDFIKETEIEDKILHNKYILPLYGWTNEFQRLREFDPEIFNTAETQLKLKYLHKKGREIISNSKKTRLQKMRILLTPLKNDPEFTDLNDDKTIKLKYGGIINIDSYLRSLKELFTKSHAKKYCGVYRIRELLETFFNSPYEQFLEYFTHDSLDYTRDITKQKQSFTQKFHLTLVQLAAYEKAQKKVTEKINSLKKEAIKNNIKNLEKNISGIVIAKEVNKKIKSAKEILGNDTEITLKPNSELAKKIEQELLLSLQNNKKSKRR